MREEFEKLPEIAKLLKIGVYWDDEYEQYDAVNGVNTQYVTFIDAAWYAFQEQQKKIDILTK